MGNINNFNFKNLHLNLSNSDYWDMFLSSDGAASPICTGVTSGDSFVVWYDFDNSNIYSTGTTSATSIYSLVTWTGATNTGYTMNTIGLTGIDNGLVTFDKTTGDTSNQALLSALTGTTLVIPSGDTRLNLNRVTGTTDQYIYPIDILSDSATTVGDYANLCGGFYQGYYKLDGNTYEILPNRVEEAWSSEFWLNPQDLCSGYTATILNDDYPDNKGIFFYMGTRAENKFWNIFEGENTGCTSACTSSTACTGTVTTYCTVPKETDITIVGDYGVGIPLSPPQVTIDLIENQFLIYGRGHDDTPAKLTGASGTIIDNGPLSTGHTGNSSCGKCSNNTAFGTKTVCSYGGNGLVVVRIAEEVMNNKNPFLIYGRGAKTTSTGSTCTSCGGNHNNNGTESVCSFSGVSGPIDEVDYAADIIDNALAFRIKDDGSIGYRLLTVTGQCETINGEDKYVSGTTIEEAYSASGAVSGDTWSYIAVRFVTEKDDTCALPTSKPRKGKLMFYVNAKLKLVVNDFDELVAKRLNEYKDKQVGVPFNFSLGGGSQGLIESQTFDGLDPADRGLPIETNFAGTFIGGISQFKFNVSDLRFCDIEYNFALDAARYGINILNYGNC